MGVGGVEGIYYLGGEGRWVTSTRSTGEGKERLCSSPRRHFTGMQILDVKKCTNAKRDAQQTRSR